MRVEFKKEEISNTMNIIDDDTNQVICSRGWEGAFPRIGDKIQLKERDTILEVVDFVGDMCLGKVFLYVKDSKLEKIKLV